jgi:hypothetical protein
MVPDNDVSPEPSYELPLVRRGALETQPLDTVNDGEKMLRLADESPMSWYSTPESGLSVGS